MSEHEHYHEHDENCTCGCHDHEHEHHHEHDENCTCGCHDHDHEHEHHHEHDENCTCGCHDHEHGHAHVHGRDVDGIHIEHHIQDEACVVSGVMRFSGVYEGLSPRIAEKLEALAAEINARGGIVGHVKAAAEVLQTEMFSVTDVKAMIKTAPTQDITVKMAAIVFAIEPETVEGMVEAALRALRG